jgi:hypothetical protein
MLYIVQPPKANFQQHFNNVISGKITTLGQSVTINHAFEQTDGGLWVRRAQIVAYSRTSTGLMRRVIPTDVAQDRLLVQIKLGNGRQLMSTPMDIHAFNAVFDDPHFPGWTIPAGTNMTITVTHEQGTTANFTAPIDISSSLSGFILEPTKE